MDLADETGNVVVITGSGWSVCDVREVPGAVVPARQACSRRSSRPGPGTSWRP